ncbi:MAG TPA: hypothetical protein ENK91_11990, partial [Bacteroidetes bacterium]|nr:hypothetical protein [Bacteroidota bacterium]
MMSVNDIEKKRSQFSYRCVKNVFKFQNENTIFKTFLENKLAHSKEKDDNKKENEIKEKKQDIQKFLDNQTNFKYLTKDELEKAKKLFGKDYKSY